MFSILQEQKRLSDRKREMTTVLAEEVFRLLINCGKARERGEVAIIFIDFSLGRRATCDWRKQIADDRNNDHANEGTEQVF